MTKNSVIQVFRRKRLLAIFHLVRVCPPFDVPGHAVATATSTRRQVKNAILERRTHPAVTTPEALDPAAVGSPDVATGTAMERPTNNATTQIPTTMTGAPMPAPCRQCPK